MKTKVIVENAFASDGHGAMIRGKVTDGTLLIGMKYNISGKIITIKSLEKGHSDVKRVRTDENFTAVINGGTAELLKPILKTEIEFYNDGYNLEKPLNDDKKSGFIDIKSILKK